MGKTRDGLQVSHPLPICLPASSFPFHLLKSSASDKNLHATYRFLLPFYFYFSFLPVALLRILYRSSIGSSNSVYFPPLLSRFSRLFIFYCRFTFSFGFRSPPPPTHPASTPSSTCFALLPLPRHFILYFAVVIVVVYRALIVVVYRTLIGNI